MNTLHPLLQLNKYYSNLVDLFQKLDQKSISRRKCMSERATVKLLIYELHSALLTTNYEMDSC